MLAGASITFFWAQGVEGNLHGIANTIALWSFIFFASAIIIFYITLSRAFQKVIDAANWVKKRYGGED